MKAGLLFIVFISVFCKAQEPSLYFEKITVQNGLSHNKVNCILQDKRGFIWLGTDDGLNRYDGKNFIHFRSRPNDSTSISGNIITAILEDGDSRLWIATADGGLSRYDYRLPPQLQFRQYKHISGNAASIPVTTINALLDDKRGYLWLGTSGRSVLRFNKATEHFDDITKSPKTVLDLCADKEGTVWVGRQGGGLLKINPVTLSCSEDHRYADLYARLPHVTVTALFKDSEDAMWYGSWDKVLYKQPATSGKEEVFGSGGPYTFQSDEIGSFAQDGYGRIWMGGKEKGVHIFDKQSNRFYNFRYDPSKEGSISDNRINCIFIDRQGRIWIGTARGVCINNPVKQQFVQHFLSGGPGPPITVYDFYEDGEKNLWIGTSTGIFIRRADGTFTKRALFYKGVPLQVTCFFRDDSTFYVGTNYSLFTYNRQTNSVTLLPNTEKDSVMNGLIESRIVSIVKTTINGRPVMLTSPYGHFLAYYDLQKKRWVSRLDSMNIVRKFNLKDNLIRKFYKTKAGTVWLATSREGLGLWANNPLPTVSYFTHNPTDPLSIAGNNVYDMTEDESGNLWVGTYGGGLHYFDVKRNRFTQIGASNNLIEGVQTDHHRNVWMISNGDLHKYDPRRQTYTTYDLPDLEKTGGVKGKIFKDTRGRLYVAGTNYFISLHPDSITEINATPKVYLTDFRILDQSFSHLLAQKEIRLNYLDNYFAFEFSAPDFSPGTALRYSYRMENFDKDWVDAGDRNYVSYSNLAGGDYVFRVRVTNAAGVWSKDYAAVRLIVIPPFWKRWWFFALLALAAAAAVYSVYRYRINELVKRQAIRNKIAQDLHDNVGSTLSSISVYSQVAKIYHQQQKQDDLQTTLEKISATSSEMISELNDTVWAINPRNDNMETILQRMESLARPLLASQGIQFYFEHDKEISAVNLDMEKRKNFYLIFKEAVNNVLKYAECKNLRISIRQKGNTLLMKIRDDGKGFDLAKTSEGYKSSDVYGGGNGLKNMQLRAKEMKGHLKIETAPGRGSGVELYFPIT